jgi:hypothetical protein
MVALATPTTQASRLEYSDELLTQKELDPDAIAFNSNNYRYHFPAKTYVPFRGVPLQTMILGPLTRKYGHSVRVMDEDTGAISQVELRIWSFAAGIEFQMTSSRLDILDDANVSGGLAKHGGPPSIGADFWISGAAGLLSPNGGLLFGHGGKSKPPPPPKVDNRCYCRFQNQRIVFPPPPPRGCPWLPFWMRPKPWKVHIWGVGFCDSPVAGIQARCNCWRCIKWADYICEYDGGSPEYNGWTMDNGGFDGCPDWFT